jgi:DUF4097 and DUF4098 domain-containing protein YvlB
VNYTLVVPPGVTVNGSTTQGSVTLTSLNGLDVGTENGDLTVRHVTTGPIVLHAVNGSIDGTDLGGNGIQARSNNGDIALAVTTPQDITAQTTNGTVTLAVPAQPYRVSVSKQNGSVSVGVPDDPAARYRLDLSVANGEIFVRPNGS